MIWQVDRATEAVARKYPLPIYATTPTPQDLGGNFEPANWQHRLRGMDVFPAGASQASPGLIIGEFRAANYLQGLALTVCWGGMARTSNRYIYRQHSLEHIYDVLDKCAKDISQTQSIQSSWNALTQQLEWTNVITSKTLHFLCRALGFEDNPPVPIDRGVVLNYVWPGFRMGIPPKQRADVGGWDGNTYAAYSRYMTAILTWAHLRQPAWTTTQIEATIYDENAP